MSFPTDGVWTVLPHRASDDFVAELSSVASGRKRSWWQRFVAWLKRKAKGGGW